LHPTLASLIALQALDTATEQARKRLAELPAAEEALSARVAEAGEAVTAAEARLKENGEARRALEKDVAVVDGRLARFEEHKAAVKTNQEYTALLHEIATARHDKDGLEERILLLMEAADAETASLRGAEAALAGARREAETGRAALAAEREALTRELTRLGDRRRHEVHDVPAPLLARYDQLLKGRRGLAVAPMQGELCTACHVRLRPHVAQQVRRNDEIVQCESCQRILYFQAPPLEG
jgi:predicted  nucleic acid-binding Zn-ribbon protein